MANLVCLRPQGDFKEVGVDIPEVFRTTFFLNRDEEQIARACQDAEFIMASSHYPRITRRIIEGCPRLRLIQLTGSGYDTVDQKAASEKGVPVAHAPGCNSKAVAEFTFGLILSLRRGIHEGELELRNGRYQEFRSQIGSEGLWELEGETLGIIGLGRIGREVAKIGRFFGMKIFYYDVVKLPPDSELAGACTYLPLHDLLSVSDIVTVHLFLDENTRKLIGQKELSLMKPTAVLINTARGAIVDEGGLTEAVRRRVIWGAAVDAFEKEPLPLDHPFLSLGYQESLRLVLTPHLAGGTIQTRRRMFQTSVNNVLAVLNGQEPQFVVNPDCFKKRV